MLQDLVRMFPDCKWIIVGGSPCQDLTFAGPWRGLLGLIGPGSRLFFVLLCVISSMQRLVGPTAVRYLVENAASMLQIHLDAFCQLLRIPVDYHGRSAFPGAMRFGQLLVACQSAHPSRKAPLILQEYILISHQNGNQTQCRPVASGKDHTARITAVGGYPSFFLRIGTTDETPSNNEMIPYLPLLTALAGVTPLTSVWLLKVLLCTRKTLQQAVPGVQGGGPSCFDRSFPAYAASLIPLSSLEACSPLAAIVSSC